MYHAQLLYSEPFFLTMVFLDNVNKKALCRFKTKKIKTTVKTPLKSLSIPLKFKSCNNFKSSLENRVRFLLAYKKTQEKMFSRL